MSSYWKTFSQRLGICQNIHISFSILFQSHFLKKKNLAIIFSQRNQRNVILKEKKKKSNQEKLEGKKKEIQNFYRNWVFILLHEVRNSFFMRKVLTPTYKYNSWPNIQTLRLHLELILLISQSKYWSLILFPSELKLKFSIRILFVIKMTVEEKEYYKFDFLLKKVMSSESFWEFLRRFFWKSIEKVSKMWVRRHA